MIKLNSLFDILLLSQTTVYSALLTSHNSLETVGMRKDTFVFTLWPFIQKTQAALSGRDINTRMEALDVIMQLIFSQMMETGNLWEASFWPWKSYSGYLFEVLKTPLVKSAFALGDYWIVLNHSFKVEISDLKFLMFIRVL